MSRQIEVHRKGDRQRFVAPKLKSWRHEDELKAAIGKSITLYGHAEWCATGTLVNTDQYTVQLAVPLHDNSIFTYYKSALLGYRIGG